MSLFGMLNWHYLWFRDGKGMTREAYARMAAGLVLAGAEDAIASIGPVSETTVAKRSSSKKKTEKARPVAGRVL
jgi:hypothetical protein